MYLLHPSVSWLRVSPTKLQVRAPDGARVTFDKDTEVIERVLERLAVGEKSGAPGEIAETEQELIKLFGPSNWVIDGKEKPSGDVLMHLVDFMARKNGAPTRASGGAVANVVGTGFVAEAVRQALNETEFPVVSGGVKPLNVVCADVDDQSLCRKQNRTFSEAKQPVTFIRFAAPWLYLGPYVVPGECACFECMVERRLNNLKFSEEAIAEIVDAAQERSGGSEVVSPALASLVRFAATQHISAICGKLLTVVEPGVVYGLNVMDLHSLKQPLLKLPRCPVCGRARGSEFDRAIRDMGN